MANFERCILRIELSYWLRDEDGSLHDLGKMTSDEAIAYSIRNRLQIRVIHSQQSQGGFARDVARERFGLYRANASLWFVATCSVAIWARY